MLVQGHGQTFLKNQGISLDEGAVYTKKSEIASIVLKNSTLSIVNQKIFNEFWTKIYSSKKLSDKSSAKYDYIRALKIIDPLPLATSSIGDLQEAIEKNSKNNSQSRRVTNRLNEIFKFLDRKDRLSKDKEELKVIKHLTIDELDKVLKVTLDSELKALIATLFATGCRLGEAMALTSNDYNKSQGTLYVGKQLTSKDILKLPKRERVGNVAVLGKYSKYIEQWVEVEDKNSYRDKVYDELKKTSKSIFKNKDKHISPHDLRHSHAIYLLGRGASLQMIALNLRNRIEVCQKYYTGYAHTNETIEGLKKLM